MSTNLLIAVTVPQGKGAASHAVEVARDLFTELSNTLQDAGLTKLQDKHLPVHISRSHDEIQAQLLIQTDNKQAPSSAQEHKLIPGMEVMLDPETEGNIIAITYTGILSGWVCTLQSKHGAKFRIVPADQVLKPGQMLDLEAFWNTHDFYWDIHREEYRKRGQRLSLKDAILQWRATEARTVTPPF